MIEIRGLTSHAEFQDAVRLQQQIWGFEEIELLPLRLFVVALKVGGQVFGAFDGQRMVGFCLAIPGLKQGGSKAGGKSYLHSHMLGVLPEYRDAGVGRRLKLAQRDEALVRGIDLIEWTFDPLEIKNAFFNIERLGAIVRRYVFNQYGTTTSHLHGGLPTDRCIAEWWIGSPRAEAIIAGRPFERNPIEVRIAIPSEIANDTLARARARARNSAAGQCVSSSGIRCGPGGDRFREVQGSGDIPARQMGIKLERITLRQIRMPLVHFFETSFGRTTERHMVLVEAVADGVSGWGECTAGENPFYNEEWTDSAWLILRDYVAPRVLNFKFENAEGSGRPNRAHSRSQHGARGPGSRGLGSGSAYARASPFINTSAAARGARFRAACPSVSRTRFPSCCRKSRRNSRPDTSASR